MNALAAKFRSAESRVGLVAALYAFYLLIFIGFGDNALQLWPEITICLAAFIMCCYLVTVTRFEIQVFFIIFAAGLLGDFLNVLLLQTGDPDWLTNLIGPLDPDEQDNYRLDGSSLFYGMHLFLWNCAWALLLFRKTRQVREGITYLVIGGILMVGVIALLAYQLENFNFNFSVLGERLHFIFLALELTGVLLGLLCVLMGVNSALLLLIIGFTIGAGNDIIAVFQELPDQHASTEQAFFAVIATLDLSGEILNPLWALGKCVVLIGLLTLPVIAKPSEITEHIGMHYFDAKRHVQSALSVYLLIFWLLSVAAAIAGVHFLNETPHFLAMFLVLFSTLCVILMASITSHFDATVDFLSGWIKDLFRNRLSDRDHSAHKLTNKIWLSVTGLERILETSEEAAEEMRDDVIFLGPEKLNRPAARPKQEGEVNCFLVMPFSTEWSRKVAAVMRDVCRENNIHAVRGDDMQRTSDILDDIWTGIIEADLVIADVTGANANVFYELGMAHAIGIPVIILAQDIDEVPFDIASRRMIRYSEDDLDALKENLVGFITELVKHYELR